MLKSEFIRLSANLLIIVAAGSRQPVIWKEVDAVSFLCSCCVYIIHYVHFQAIWCTHRSQLPCPSRCRTGSPSGDTACNITSCIYSVCSCILLIYIKAVCFSGLVSIFSVYYTHKMQTLILLFTCLSCSLSPGHSRSVTPGWCWPQPCWPAARDQRANWTGVSRSSPWCDLSITPNTSFLPR